MVLMAVVAASAPAFADDPTYTYGKKDDVKDVKDTTWTAKGELGLVSVTGNAKTTTITAGANAVRKDPVTALKKADAQRRAFAGPIDADDAPLELVLDMPVGGKPTGGDISDHAADIVIPKLPSLVHDAAFFKSIKGRGFHGGLLDGLAGFYP